MKKQNFLLPAIALGALATLVSFPAQSEAFVTFGFSLSTDQRDIRVFNNFTDSGSNNNNLADPNWPGYVGAPLAIWKAATEWASEPHNNNGAGDPSQIVGSGGANFDPSWQGLASGTGTTTQNICSELSGSSGNTLAFVESPNSNGWRMRFYADAANWQDGPNTASGGYDIQGVATHEYGHCLGLGHSATGSATMFGTASFQGNADRSIAADDIAGVQDIYGVASASKPHVTSYSIISGNVTVTGTGFSSNNNEIWFTQAGVGGSGFPVKAVGVASPSGTSMTALLPINAGHGDLQVKAAFAGHTSLSNAIAFDPTTGICTPAVNYCQAAINSTGSTSTIYTTGTPVWSENNFGLAADNIQPNQFGIFFYGPGQAYFPLGDGFVCIGNGLNRLPIVQADFFGQAFYQIDVNNPPSPIGQIFPLDTWNFQFWHRDPGGPGGTSFNLSDAVTVEFCN
jgi:hypothetical protein